MEQLFIKIESMSNTDGTFDAVIHVDDGKTAVTRRYSNRSEFLAGVEDAFNEEKEDESK